MDASGRQTGSPRSRFTFFFVASAFARLGTPRASHGRATTSVGYRARRILTGQVSPAPFHAARYRPCIAHVTTAPWSSESFAFDYNSRALRGFPSASTATMTFAEVASTGLLRADSGQRQCSGSSINVARAPHPPPSIDARATVPSSRYGFTGWLPAPPHAAIAIVDSATANEVFPMNGSVHPPALR